MAAFIVAYDLHKHGQNYDCITKKIEAYGYYWHMQASVWILKTDQSAVQIRDNLASCIDSNDKLFVGKLSGEAAWLGYDKKVSDWLMETL